MASKAGVIPKTSDPKTKAAIKAAMAAGEAKAAQAAKEAPVAAVVKAAPVEVAQVTAPVAEVHPAGNTSLLNAVMTAYDTDKNARTSRLLLAAEVVQGQGQGGEVEDKIASLGEALKTEYEGAGEDPTMKVTGYLILLGKKMIIYMLETRTTAILNLFRSLPSLSHTITNARILHFSENVPREFPVHAFRSITADPAEFTPPDNKDANADMDWTELNFSIIRGLLDIGHEVSTMAEKAAEYLKTSASRQFLNQIPSVEKIQAICTWNQLFPVEEYLALYDVPADLTLESEKAWPAPPGLQY